MSITQTLKSPPLWSPAYNPIVWMVESDQTASAKFRYVFDVYINDDPFLRFKVPPNPSGKGLIDVSSLVQGSLNIHQNLPFLGSEYYTNGEGLAARVYVLAGEEYATSPSSPSELYNGLGGTGNPAYGLYAEGNFRPAPNATTPVVAWTSGQDSDLNYDYMASQGEDIINYEMTKNLVVDTNGKFLTRCPYTPQEIRSDEDFTLTWLNYSFESAVQAQRTPYAMKITTFNGGATVGATGIYNIEVEGGTWTSCTTLGTGATATSALLNSFHLNMADVPTIIPGTFDTVKFQLFTYGSTGTCSIGATGVSEVITLKINDDNCWGFEPIRITWMNNLGGRDWFTFLKRNTYIQRAERDTFYSIPKYWSGSNWSINDISPARWGTTPYKVKLENTWTASTDWLNEEQSEWLRGLFASPSVYAYLPGKSQPFRIVVTDANYTVQTFAREKLFQYFISFIEAQPGVVQGF